MGVLKWIGYIVAAILVLTVALGGGLLIAAIMAIGAALLCLVGLVTLTALLIKSLFDEVLRPRGKKP